MGFKVLVENADGSRDVVHEVTDKRVTRVGLSGAQGEAAGMRIDFGVEEVVLTFDYEITNGRPTLHDVEAEFAPTTAPPADEDVVGDEEVAASEEGEPQTGEASDEVPPTEEDNPDKSATGESSGLSLGSMD